MPLLAALALALVNVLGPLADRHTPSGWADPTTVCDKGLDTLLGRDIARGMSAWERQKHRAEMRALLARPEAEPHEGLGWAADITRPPALLDYDRRPFDEDAGRLIGMPGRHITPPGLPRVLPPEPYQALTVHLAPTRSRPYQLTRDFPLCRYISATGRFDLSPGPSNTPLEPPSEPAPPK